MAPKEVFEPVVPKHQELACTLAALALHDEGMEIEADKMFALIEAAGIPLDKFWPKMFVRMINARGIDDLVFTVGGGAAAAAAAPAAAGGAAPAGDSAAAPAESKKDEPEEESDDDMGFGLFD
eukprot:Rmarinus@m.25343